MTWTPKGLSCGCSELLQRAKMCDLVMQLSNGYWAGFESQTDQIVEVGNIRNMEDENSTQRLLKIIPLFWNCTQLD